MFYLYALTSGRDESFNTYFYKLKAHHEGKYVSNVFSYNSCYCGRVEKKNARPWRKTTRRKFGM